MQLWENNAWSYVSNIYFLHNIGILSLSFPQLITSLSKLKHWIKKSGKVTYSNHSYTINAKEYISRLTRMQLNRISRICKNQAPRLQKRGITCNTQSLATIHTNLQGQKYFSTSNNSFKTMRLERNLASTNTNPMIATQAKGQRMHWPTTTQVS